MDKPTNDAVDQTAGSVAKAATGIAAAAKDTIDQVNDKIQELPGPAVEMLDRARSAAADVGDAAQDIVHRARDQATAAADTMHQQSRRLGEYLSQNTEQNPLTALLIAGAVGYGLAYLMNRR
jgi:ElaB/YqjD/DUF883 family membrane-anchored ribosome-binding protein